MKDYIIVVEDIGDHYNNRFHIERLTDKSKDYIEGFIKALKICYPDKLITKEEIC